MPIKYNFTRTQWPKDITVTARDKNSSTIGINLRALVDTASEYVVLDPVLALNHADRFVGEWRGCETVIDIPGVGSYRSIATCNYPIVSGAQVIIGRPILDKLYLLLDGPKATLSSSALSVSGELLHTAKISVSGIPYYRDVTVTTPGSSAPQRLDLYTVHDTGAQVSVLSPDGAKRLGITRHLQPTKNPLIKMTKLKLAIERWQIDLPALQVKWRTGKRDDGQPQLLLGRPELNTAKLLWSGPAAKSDRLKVYEL